MENSDLKHKAGSSTIVDHLNVISKFSKTGPMWQDSMQVKKPVEDRFVMQEVFPAPKPAELEWVKKIIRIDALKMIAEKI